MQKTKNYYDYCSLVKFDRHLLHNTTGALIFVYGLRHQLMNAAQNY